MSIVANKTRSKVSIVANMHGKQRYSLSDIQNAINELKEHPNKSLSSVAKQFSVPETILHCYFKDSTLVFTRGPSFLLTQKKEQALVEHVNQFNFFGIKISFVQLKSKAKEILKEMESETTTMVEII